MRTTIKAWMSLNLGRILMLTSELAALEGLKKQHNIEPRHEKTNVLVSDLVRHKSGCTATEDG